jgi:hypothetical protein
VDGRVTVLLREVCPRDFYWFSLVENDYPDLEPGLFNILLLLMLTDADEDNHELDLIPVECLAPLSSWMMKELVSERIMKVEQWLEMSFHLCKQRWDDTTEWLESQPMSKILLMSRVVSKFVAEQNREMKKGSKK